MSNRYQGGKTGTSYAEQNLNAFFAPAAAIGTWEPLLALVLKGNAEAQQRLGSIATEWQGFVRHRLQEDITLTQRLTDCRGSEQIIAAYTDFWHKAAEDYGKEITTMTKLVTGLTREMVLAAQSPADEGHTSSHLSDRAAD